MIQNIKAVIFDLDGSLVDSMWIWREIDIEFMNRYGYATTREELDAFQAEIDGMSFRETAEWVSSHYNIPRTVEEMMDDWNDMAWDKYAKEVPLKEGVREFLDKCQQNNIKLGIASSNSRELVENVLTVHGIMDYFECIRTGSDGLPGKPAPDIYLMACEKLGADPKSAYAVEDSYNGIRSAHAAGMHAIMVPDMAPPTDEMHSLACAVLPDLIAVRDWLAAREAM